MGNSSQTSTIKCSMQIRWMICLRAIAKTLDGGSVVIIQKTLSVLANTYCNVPGRLGNETYEVDVMWCFPDMSERFSQNLAPDTKKRFTVPDSSLCDYICGSGITSNFPYN